MRVARPFQGRVAGLKAPRYINIENAPAVQIPIGASRKSLVMNPRSRTAVQVFDQAGQILTAVTRTDGHRPSPTRRSRSWNRGSARRGSKPGRRRTPGL